MAEFQMEEANGQRSGAVAELRLDQRRVENRSLGEPVARRELAVGAAPPESSSDERAILGAYARELDLYYAGMNSFEGMEPDEVMARIAAMVARLTEIRARLHRLGTTRATQLRTKEIDPLLDSLKLLFQIHSRLLASRQFDFEVTRGAV